MTRPDRVEFSSGGFAQSQWHALVFFCVVLGLASCTAPEDIGPCNGHAALCGRSLNQVAFLTSHNAMASDENQFFAPNHKHGITRQLSDGVRGFMLDVYWEDEELLLCHGHCQFGSIPFANVAQEMAVFLQENPREVIVLLFESYAPVDVLASGIEDGALGSWLITQPAGQPWPTLGRLIKDDARLLVMTDDETPGPDWLHYVWDHAWETDWNAQAKTDFSCDPNRGDPNHPLFIFNHFLTNPVAMRSLAEQVNFNPFLLERAQACAAESGRQPNLVTVDFYSIGDGMRTVDILNGVSSDE